MIQYGSGLRLHRAEIAADLTLCPVEQVSLSLGRKSSALTVFAKASPGSPVSWGGGYSSGKAGSRALLQSANCTRDCNGHGECVEDGFGTSACACEMGWDPASNCSVPELCTDFGGATDPDLDKQA